MTKRYFVTGTDTEVGKTVASCALLQAATQLGYQTVGYKPVASGSEMTTDGLRDAPPCSVTAACRNLIPLSILILLPSLPLPHR